jgi:hypothetical protein
MDYLCHKNHNIIALYILCFKPHESDGKALPRSLCGDIDMVQVLNQHKRKEFWERTVR